MQSPIDRLPIATFFSRDCPWPCGDRCMPGVLDHSPRVLCNLAWFLSTEGWSQSAELPGGSCFGEIAHNNTQKWVVHVPRRKGSQICVYQLKAICKARIIDYPWDLVLE